MLVLRDADETLSLFEADGDIDRAQFADVIGGLLQDAGAGGRDVRVYGEMVARLWDRGPVPAAIELEDLWNELSRGLPFALLCAYPATITDDPQSATSFSAVCACHTHVLDGAPELTGEVTGRFPAAPTRQAWPAGWLRAASMSGAMTRSWTTRYWSSES